RNIDISQATNFWRPNARTVYDNVTCNFAPVSHRRHNPTAALFESDDGDALKNFYAVLTGTGRESLGGVDRIRLPISGNESATDDSRGIEQWIMVFDFSRRQNMRLDTEVPPEGHEPLDLDQAFRSAGDWQTTALLKTRVLTSFDFELR